MNYESSYTVHVHGHPQARTHDLNGLALAILSKDGIKVSLHGAHGDHRHVHER